MKNTKKSLISTLKEIKENLSRNTDEDLREIWNACIDYQNETQDRCLEKCFNDFMDYDLAEEYAKHEIERGGLIRMRYATGNLTDFNCDYFRLNAYGNLENVKKEDLEYLIDDCIDRLEN